MTSEQEALWKMAQDECDAFECDNDGRCFEDGMHFRNPSALAKFAELVVARAALAGSAVPADAYVPRDEAETLTDDDWQAIADDAHCVIWSRIKQAVNRRLTAAPKAQPSQSPVDPCLQGWLAALSDAFHAAKKAGNSHTAEKLNEVLNHLASQAQAPQGSSNDRQHQG